jgi:hypothetical protein
MKVSTEKAYNKKKYACFSEEKKITEKWNSLYAMRKIDQVG